MDFPRSVCRPDGSDHSNTYVRVRISLSFQYPRFENVFHVIASAIPRHVWVSRRVKSLQGPSSVRTIVYTAGTVQVKASMLTKLLATMSLD